MDNIHCQTVQTTLVKMYVAFMGEPSSQFLITLTITVKLGRSSIIILNLH